LAMRPREARHPSDVQSCVGVLLDNCREVPHWEVLPTCNDTKTPMLVRAAELLVDRDAAR
jgi:hypothetical protein